MMYFWFYLILLILVIFAIDWFAKKGYFNRKFTRKLTHIFTGIIVYTFPVFLTTLQISILSIVFTFLMGISKFRGILILNNTERVTWGEVYFPVSVGICALFSLPHNNNSYFIGILCLTFADTFANIVGTILPFKILKIGKQNKSLGGFLACTIVVFIIFSIFFPIETNTILLIIAISILIAFIEFVSIYGTDNITVPVAATILSLILNNYSYVHYNCFFN